MFQSLRYFYKDFHAFFIVVKNLIISPHFIVLTAAGNTIIFIFATFFYLAESGENPLVDEKMDAVWWAFTTVTTVGFGDIVPVTFWGRVIGIGLMLMGTAIFACYVGLISEAFLSVELDRFDRKISRKKRFAARKESKQQSK